MQNIFKEKEAELYYHLNCFTEASVRALRNIIDEPRLNSEEKQELISKLALRHLWMGLFLDGKPVGTLDELAWNGEFPLPDKKTIEKLYGEQ